jgi:DNA-binding NtrC family response regulator
VQQLEHTKVKNIPRERLRSVAFIEELYQLGNGREKGNKFCPSLLWEVPEISEEEMEQMERTSIARGGLIGKSEQLNGIWKLIEKAGPVELPVLITGETGVGKGLVAGAIHDNSPRRHGPFQKIEISSIDENLLDSELFGYQKGAFTGAVRNKPGKVEMAHKGSLFLDEIGALPVGLQPKLLRFIEEKQFDRVGSVETRKVDCRIIAATNENLKKMVQEGKFRKDLYFRLKGFEIEVAPLRDRREDIPYLAMHFLRRQLGKEAVKPISKEAMEIMVNYDWPGNVRELRYCIERASILAEGSEIKPKDLKISIAEENRELEPLEKTIAQVSGEQILNALHISRGNQTQAAKLLGMRNEKALRNLMKKVAVLNPYSTKPGRPSKKQFDK